MINMVATQGQNDEKELYDLCGTKEYRKMLDRQFKNNDSNFRIAVVVDMWITGFDVPSLAVMYIDKPLQKHTLIQTISRVNRVFEGKDRGLVVDYIGIKNDITNLKSELDNYSMQALFGREKPVDFIGDARLLRAILHNYKLNLRSGLYKVFGSGDSGINLTQNVTQDVATNVDISLESTISLVNELPVQTLSEEEKEQLIGKLAGLSAEKKKEKRWEKITSVLKWIAEKGIEVGTVALPYIAKALGEQS